MRRGEEGILAVLENAADIRSGNTHMLASRGLPTEIVSSLSLPRLVDLAALEVAYVW